MIPCAKLNGNGNDFIVLDNRESRWTTQEMSAMARSLCRRREALGADGILVVEASARLHFRMRIFNRDGSEGEMCGNGARCIARYAYETGIAPREMTFETLAGDVQVSVDPPMARLAMGEVSLSEAILDRRLEMDGLQLNYSFLTVGVPHAVLFMEDLPMSPTEEITRLGRSLRHRTDLFPKGANINFVSLEKGGLRVMTYERGVEEITLSCGTGSTASAIVGCLLDRCGTETEVRNPGGINQVSLVFEGKEKVRPFLTGRTALVAWAEILEEALA